LKHSYVTVTDQFCGAGGSSLGAQKAGCEIYLALNHWDLAVKTHNTNFPNTAHDCVDISACDPRRYPSTTILLTSPECTNHTLAKGKKRKNLNQLDLFNPQVIDPSEERSRATMWDVVRFAEYHQYEFVIVENVVDVRYWTLFDTWLEAMRVLDYEHELVYFNSQFAYPTPQSRDRLYIVFWKRKNRKPDLNFTPLAYCIKCSEDVHGVQSWKNPLRKAGRYGKRNQYIYRCPRCREEVQPYYTPAYTAIDWSLPTQRIGDREKPLKPATIERIRKGLEKFTVHMVVGTDHTQDKSGKCWPVDAVLPTQTARQTAALATRPFIVRNYSGQPRPTGLEEPLPTITTVDHNSLVQPFVITERFDGVHRSLNEPLPTVMAANGRVHHRLVQPFMVTLRNNSTPGRVEQPLDTVVASGLHHGLVQPFMISYYSNSEEAQPLSEPIPTVTTKDRHALVQPFLVNYYTPRVSLNGVDETFSTVSTQPRTYLAQPSDPISVEDCGFRMLQPSEIHRAMAFPGNYIVLGNKREQVKQYGNAVTPPVMEMLVERCIETLK
jgi:DNA (cytosine-5)-methyltransferase 1